MTGASTPLTCACGAEIELHCGEHMPNAEFDLTLECSSGCGAPVLNAFVPVEAFVRVDVPASAPKASGA